MREISGAVAAQKAKMKGEYMRLSSESNTFCACASKFARSKCLQMKSKTDIVVGGY